MRIRIAAASAVLALGGVACSSSTEAAKVPIRPATAADREVCGIPAMARGASSPLAMLNAMAAIRGMRADDEGVELNRLDMVFILDAVSDDRPPVTADGLSPADVGSNLRNACRAIGIDT